MKNCITFILCFFSFILNAQTTINIQGIVVDDQQQAVAWATIALYDDVDNSNLITGTYTDENGAFTISSPQNTGVLIISYVGGGEYTQAINSTEDMHLGKITLTNSVTLEGVEVTASKAQITFENGTLSFINNGQSVAQDGLELLKTVPLVMPDKDDNLLLKGSTAKILINGKDLKLHGEELKSYLKSLTPDMIEKVEVITNPSARHEAEGAMGMINIITKRKPQGLFSSVTLSANYRRFLNNRQSASLSYYANKFGLALDVVRSDYGYYNDLSINKFTLDNNTPEPFSKERSILNGNGLYHSSNLSLSYELTENSSLSSFLKINHTDSKSTNEGSSLFNLNGQNSTTTLDNRETELSKNITTGLNYILNLDTLGKQLTMDYLYVKSDRNNPIKQVSNFFANDEMLDDFQLDQLKQLNYDVHSLRTDFTQPVTKGCKIETGLKYSHVVNSSALDYNFSEADSNYILLPIMDNDFRFEENIFAAYITSDFQYKSFSFRTGLRAEYTAFNHLLENAETIATNKDNYLDFFPNIAATYSTEQGNSLSFSYSRRLDRPNYRSFNPSIFYLTQYTYVQGNPYLEAEYSNNFELDAKIGSTVISLFANFTNQGINDYVEQDLDLNTTLLKTANFSTNRYLGAMVNTSLDLTKTTSLRVSASGQYQSARLELTNNDVSERLFSVGAQASLNQKISSNISASWSANYNSPFLSGAYRVKGQFTNNVNISYNLNQWSISLGMRDIFSAGRWDSNLETSQIRTNWVNTWRTGVMSLSVNYSFGNQKAAGKGKYNGKKSSKETQRI